MPYAKPYLPVPDQIALLEGRGMQIPDHGKATEYLKRIGYYRLSAYWYPMRQAIHAADGSFTVSDQFKDGSDFKTVVDLYAFDKTLRLIMLDALERIEVSLRTEIALTIGRYDPLAHRDPARLDRNFTTPSGGSKFDEWLARLDDRAARSKEEFADHFRKKYPGSHMPIWIAVELLDFGPLSHFLSGMAYRDLQTIGGGYGGVRPHLLKSWIRALCGVRNVCAHHARLWNRPLVDQPSLPRKNEIADLDHLSMNSRLYAAAAVCRYLLKEVNPRTKWVDRLKQHMTTFPKSPLISVDATGFPKGWEQLALWK